MRVFVTGATGYIGSAVVRELIDAHHTVVGLARSDRGATLLKEAGAEVQYGTLDDLDSLHRSAAAADGVIHLAFPHGGADIAGADATTTNLRAVATMGGAMGIGKPFVITAHLNGEATENTALAQVERGVRTVIVLLAPSVHDGDADKHGFVPTLITTARTKGVSAYMAYM